MTWRSMPTDDKSLIAGEGEMESHSTRGESVGLSGDGDVVAAKDKAQKPASDGCGRTEI